MREEAEFSAIADPGMTNDGALLYIYYIFHTRILLP
jgi:hypothetical protein